MEQKELEAQIEELKIKYKSACAKTQYMIEQLKKQEDKCQVLWDSTMNTISQLYEIKKTHP